MAGFASRSKIPEIVINFTVITLQYLRFLPRKERLIVKTCKFLKNINSYRCRDQNNKKAFLLGKVEIFDISLIYES